MEERGKQSHSRACFSPSDLRPFSSFFPAVRCPEAPQRWWPVCRLWLWLVLCHPHSGGTPFSQDTAYSSRRLDTPTHSQGTPSRHAWAPPFSQTRVIPAASPRPLLPLQPGPHNDLQGSAPREQVHRCLQPPRAPLCPQVTAVAGATAFRGSGPPIWGSWRQWGQWAPIQGPTAGFRHICPLPPPTQATLHPERPSSRFLSSPHQTPVPFSPPPRSLPPQPPLGPVTAASSRAPAPTPATC